MLYYHACIISHTSSLYVYITISMAVSACKVHRRMDVVAEAAFLATAVNYDRKMFITLAPGLQNLKEEVLVTTLFTGLVKINYHITFIL
jgi:hypothetical protein